MDSCLLVETTYQQKSLYTESSMVYLILSGLNIHCYASSVVVMVMSNRSNTMVNLLHTQVKETSSSFHAGTYRLLQWKSL
jgi:hypothetical protein